MMYLKDNWIYIQNFFFYFLNSNIFIKNNFQISNLKYRIKKLKVNVQKIGLKIKKYHFNLKYRIEKTFNPMFTIKNKNKIVLLKTFAYAYFVVYHFGYLLTFRLIYISLLLIIFLYKEMCKSFRLILFHSSFWYKKLCFYLLHQLLNQNIFYQSLILILGLKIKFLVFNSDILSKFFN